MDYEDDTWSRLSMSEKIRLFEALRDDQVLDQVLEVSISVTMNI